MEKHLLESLKSDTPSKRVHEAFSKAANSYDAHGNIQKIAADRLSKSLDPWRDWVPAGPILELGAGTGFLTRELIRMYPKRALVITDVSEELLEINRRKHADKHPNIEFRLLDANDLSNEPENHYALITHSFMMQWVHPPEQGMIAQTKILKDGGLILCTFPGESSFSEWQEQCYRHGIDFTANHLPNPEKIGIALSFEPVLIDLHEDNERVQFKDALALFRHFKRVGAHTQLGGKQNSSGELRRLIKNWPINAAGLVHLTYHMAFMAIKKDG